MTMIMPQMHIMTIDAKSKQSNQTQVKQKAQMYLSTDNGLNTGEMASEKQNLTLIPLMQMLFFLFLLNLYVFWFYSL